MDCRWARRPELLKLRAGSRRDPHSFTILCKDDGHGEFDSCLRNAAVAGGRSDGDSRRNAEAGERARGTRDDARAGGLTGADREPAQAEPGCVLQFLSGDLRPDPACLDELRFEVSQVLKGETWGTYGRAGLN